MRFQPTKIPGCFLIEPDLRRDGRGFFARLYCPDEFTAAGIEFTPVQTNLSRNDRAHTLRGLHFQDPPLAEAKLVQVVRGAIFDVVVDLRPESPAYRQWVGVELTGEDACQVFVPEGCAHGFLTLCAATDVLYGMGRKYVPGHARGYRFDDAAFGIEWPHAPASISPTDLGWAPFPG
ncbi:dTDP-4-dehydrorhamnose 3,5-epimerase family protein [Labrys monachus]|uniref:dTDP-4-dehydrorhamnose 3,5-epimerase n=1 Tax=Labrys monachus TaxID=217067 RepID=A0ABU0FF65_9HYPH|nr:dTDP-4-dehydrorhamnose 3,5-epimerase family protein [Labrys monachus]MDQ0393106.1 dTDP-4-dehydrorhamnose 3,5-epimerase [Labrys monachus]